MERSQFQTKEYHPTDVAAAVQKYSAPTIPYNQPMQASTMPTGVSAPSRSDVVTAAQVSLGGSSSAQVATKASPAVSIPAAFGNPTAAGITTPDQAQQAAQIANDFTAQVQASGVSPSSPAYQNVWNSAANRANALFKQQFGWQAFEAMQQSASSQ